MSLIVETVKKFKESKIDKPTFIKNMYEFNHSKLFEYSEYLKFTNIKCIEINNNNVILTTRDHGVRMICPENDHRTALIETLNFFDYEKEDTDMIINLVNDGDTFFDIGANAGWHSILVGALKRSSSIYSFEPIPETFNYLKENVKLNYLLNISLHEFGLSDKSGDFSFYYYPEGSVNASAKNLTGRDDVEEVKCKLETIDSFIEGSDIVVDFIKCDVEGGELLAFNGGKETIKKDLPIVFSEILRKWTKKFNYNPNEIFNFFYELGYKSFTVKDGFLFEFGFMDDDTMETNFFFLHKEKHSEVIKRYYKK